MHVKISYLSLLLFFLQIILKNLISIILRISYFNFIIPGSPVLKKQAPRTMSTLHEDANVEEAEAEAIDVEAAAAAATKVVPEDKCQPGIAQIHIRPSALSVKSQQQLPPPPPDNVSRHSNSISAIL